MYERSYLLLEIKDFIYGRKNLARLGRSCSTTSAPSYFITSASSYSINGSVLRIFDYDSALAYMFSACALPQFPPGQESNLPCSLCFVVFACRWRLQKSGKASPSRGMHNNWLRERPSTSNIRQVAAWKKEAPRVVGVKVSLLRNALACTSQPNGMAKVWTLLRDVPLHC